MDGERAEAVFMAMHRELYAYAARRSSAQIAEDVLAETFAAFWAGRDRAPADPERLRQWMFGIARHQLAASQRRGRRDMRLGVRARAAMMAGVPVVAPDAAITVVESDQMRRVYAALSARDQEIIQLHGWDGLSYAEIAAILQCSEETARTRLSRARQRVNDLTRHDDPDVQDTP